MIPGYLIDILKWLVAAATVAAVWFIVQYTLTSPWWRDQVGRTVVAMDVATLTLLVPNLIKFLWRGALTPKELGWTDVAAIGMTFVIIVIRCVIWFRIERPHSPRSQWRRHVASQEAEGAGRHRASR